MNDNAMSTSICMNREIVVQRAYTPYMPFLTLNCIKGQDYCYFLTLNGQLFCVDLATSRVFQVRVHRVSA
jgi:hypothetical protein